MSTPVEDHVRRVLAGQAASAQLPTAEVLAAVHAEAARRRQRRAYVGSGLAVATAVAAVLAVQPAGPARPTLPVAAGPTSAPTSAARTPGADVDPQAERVRALIAQDRLAGLSGLRSDPNGTRVDLWWVGPVPEQLRLLAERSGGSVVIRPGSFTADQLLAACEQVVTASSDVGAHPAWAVASVTPEPDGSGIRVGLARPGGGFPALTATETASARRQLAAAAGDVPVTDVFRTSEVVERPLPTKSPGFDVVPTMTARPVVP